MYKGTTSALGKFKKLGRRLDELLRALRLARETVRLACQKLLRHGNLLLDGEAEVQLGAPAPYGHGVLLSTLPEHPPSVCR
jgi:hypothetical protein